MKASPNVFTNTSNINEYWNSNLYSQWQQQKILNWSDIMLIFMGLPHKGNHMNQTKLARFNCNKQIYLLYLLAPITFFSSYQKSLLYNAI